MNSIPFHSDTLLILFLGVCLLVFLVFRQGLKMLFGRFMKGGKDGGAPAGKKAGGAAAAAAKAKEEEEKKRRAAEKEREEEEESQRRDEEEQERQRQEEEKKLKKFRQREEFLDWSKEKAREEEAGRQEEKVLTEKEMQSFLDQLLGEIAALADRGLSDGQVERSLASKFAYEVPSYELLPMQEAIRTALHCLDDEKYRARNKFAMKALDPKDARADLLAGRPEKAAVFIKELLNEKVNAGKGLSGERKGEADREAASLARQLATLLKAHNAREALIFGRQACALEPENARNHDVLGFVSLRMAMLDEAEAAFLEALGLEVEEAVWHAMAEEGLSMVEAARGDAGAVRAAKGRVAEAVQKKAQEAQTAEQLPPPALQHYYRLKIKMVDGGYA